MRSAPVGAQSRCTSTTKAPRFVVNCTLKTAGAFSFNVAGDRSAGWTFEARSPVGAVGAEGVGTAGGVGGVGGITDAAVAAVAAGSGAVSELLQQRARGKRTRRADRAE